MSHFLVYMHHFSDITILFSVLSACVIPVVLAPYFGRHVLRVPVSDERFTATQDGFKAIASILGILLAFSLVQANGNIRTAQDQISREAALAQAIDRSLLRIGRQDFAAVRPTLDHYLKSRVGDDWSALAHENRAAATDDAYAALSKSIRALSPGDSRETAMYSEMLKALDDIADIRELTIAEANPLDFSLGNFYWIAISIFCGIGILLALFAKPSLSSIATLGAATSAVAIMLAMLIIVDLPFQGETCVSPDPIAKAIVINARRA